ncbi:MAG TPA: LamG domain-containing protein [Verrucomicrobiae bacterium]|nr:LamG domain-containing protein [Verrucomicrobiae bacterium]
MKPTSIRFNEFMVKGLVLISLLTATQVATAALTHRYSFNDSIASTNAIDSAGSATGNLYPGATYPGDGTVVLDGASGFVYLPDDIISNYTSVTFEVWTTPTSNPTWARLFDFGRNQGGPGTGGPGGGGGNGVAWFYMCLNDGVSGSYRVDINPGNFITGTQPAAGQNHHLAFSIDAVAQTGSLFDNGQLVSFASNFTATPQAVGHTFNDYIGRSQFPDPYYNGSIDEFRIYNNPVTPVQVEADYEAGADSTSGSAGTLSSIQFNNSTNTLVGAKFSPAIFATYTSLTNKVNISTMSGITYGSDNTNIVSYESDGNFHANAAGSTTIHALFQSQPAALTVRVSLQPAVVVHRYSFNGAPGATAITDSVGGANGTLNNGSGTATLTGSGQLTLDGNASSGYVSLPSGILPALTNATFETWVQNNDVNSDWAQLWSFGTNNGVQGVNYITLIPNNPASHKLRLDNHVVSIDAPQPLSLGNEVCVVVTYNYSAQTASIYVGGRKVAVGTVTTPIYNIPDGNNYLGQSEWYGSGDPYFTGVLDEFRIYSGVVTEQQIAIDAATGPDNIITNPGTLLSLTMRASTNVDVHGVSVPIQVLANFANVTNVDVTTLSQTTLASGNTSVGTIVNGNFTPQNAGVATVTATYASISGSLAITVVDTNAWPSLLHRYTFDETSGTTLHDSIGAIDGTINGPVTLAGSQMIMPAGNPPPNGSGLPTASSGWVSYPASQGMVSGLPNEASIECWVTWAGGGVWQEMFDFGQAATPGVSLGGGTYVMVSPHDGVNGSLRMEWFPGGLVLTGPSLQVGVLSQVVITHDQDRQLDKLYLNGQLISTGSNPLLWSSLPDSDNWLARDQWPDPMFNGAYSDMRIWNGALTAGQVANLYAVGPNVIAGPALQISAAGSQITLKWPANATGFILQSTSGLAGGTWSTVSGTPTVVNGINNLTLSLAPGQTFYRLKQ